MTQDVMSGGLWDDLRTLIEGAHSRGAQVVNAGPVVLYWQVGERIHRELLLEARAAYGEQIVSTLSRQLTQRYGRGFSRANLRRMKAFAAAWPGPAGANEADAGIVQQAAAPLPWFPHSRTRPAPPLWAPPVRVGWRRGVAVMEVA